MCLELSRLLQPCFCPLHKRGQASLGTLSAFTAMDLASCVQYVGIMLLQMSRC
jgi:hypothetical protein